MWKSLKHANILPLLGATISPSQLVSALMPAGDLSKYLLKNPDSNRIGLVGVDLVALPVIAFSPQQLAFRDRRGPPLLALPKCDPWRSQGCKLLFRISTHPSIHTHQMNILVEVVDDIPHARIADFGIAIVTMNLDSIRPPTRQEAHTPRWSAPEILREQNPTKESDIYSFAMVAIEVYVNGLKYVFFLLTVTALTQVLTGEVPFSSEKTNWMVLQAVLRGDRPSRPEHPSCTDGLWELIQRCWDHEPHSRPDILEVLQTFSSISTN